MVVSCLFFASLRDLVGEASVQLELPEPATVADLLGLVEQRYPALADYRRAFQVAVDLEMVPHDAPLRSGCEVALLPAVSGGDAGIDLVRLSDVPIEVDECLRVVSRTDCGAVVLFLGTVRDSHQGETVEFIDYSAYPAMALKEMQKLAQECRERHPLGGLALWHRTGVVKAGEASVAVAVSTVHRDEAFTAARWMIDQLKSTVPIWKKEVGPGGAVWIEGDARTPSGA